MGNRQSKYAIVVVGYNRCDSLERLIQSLNRVDYLGDPVDLIVSIDYSGTDTVKTYADSLAWGYGNKIVRTFPQRQGLRNHILQCGDYTELYDAIAVFEDDIFVSPDFYNFMKQAVAFYQDDDSIAGISLYNHMFCENSQKPFTAQKGSYDNYFLKYAQSWGQIWMKKQWKAFRAWYQNHDGEIASTDQLPECIQKWPATSWLKYHIEYCILENKYFVYPYDSLSTNFVESGQHCKEPSTVYQVPMLYGQKKQYHFCPFGHTDGVYYDGFFEREEGLEEFHFPKENVLFDVNGIRKPDKQKRYFVSTQQLDFKILRSYAYQLRPAEMNVLVGIPGDTIYLYDTWEKAQNCFRDTTLDRWYYDTRVESLRYASKIVIKMIKRKFLMTLARKK